MNKLMGITIGVVGFGFSAACGGAGERATEGAAGTLRLSVAAGLKHDVTEVRFSVAQLGNGCDQAIAQSTIDLAAETPSDDGVHESAEAWFALPVGGYFVCMTPLTASGAPSSDCTSASQRANVVQQTTTQITLVSTCGLQDGGTIDVTAVLNDGPVVEDLDVSPSKYLTTCDTATITAFASDLNFDPIAFDWLVTSGAAWLTSDGDTATFGPALPGDYEVTVGVTDSYGARSGLAFPLRVTNDASCVPPTPDLSSVEQLYCTGTCGEWGGGPGCQQEDADVFCRIKLNNPDAVATSYRVAPTSAAAGICCPNTPPNTAGCVDVGVIAASGTNLDVSVHPNNLYVSHGGGEVVTDVECAE